MQGMTAPDPYEQILNQMIERTLNGEAIPFDEWEDALDELADEPDCEVVLRERGLTIHSALEQADAERADFLNRLRQYGFPLEDRFALCRSLCEQAGQEPSPELLRLFCDIVCDTGFLLDIDRTHHENNALGWLYAKEEADALYEHLSARAQKSVRFKEILAGAQKSSLPRTGYSSNHPDQQDAIFQGYIRLFDISGDKPPFKDNIAHLLQIAAGSEALTTIKPLFLYRALTRHGKRLQNSENLHIDLQSLWNYQVYKLDQDNGKNYKTNLRYLELFSALCGIFEADERVDIPLCVYGFDHLSNLGEFYRMGARTEREIPFDTPLEDLLDKSPFTCFEHGYGDNVILADSGLSVKQLDRFECSADRYRVRTLERISDYMNRHIAELVTRFLASTPGQVEALCSEILEAAALPTAQQPKDSKETALFLASINGGLMDAVDFYAINYLVQAGNALCK